MKICTKCGMRKKETAFYKNIRTRSGLRSECKDCSKDMTRMYRIKMRSSNAPRNASELVRNLGEMRDLCENLLFRVKEAVRDAKGAGVKT